LKIRKPHHPRELVALNLIPNLGAQRIKTLLARAGDPQEIFRMSRKQLSAVYGIGDVLADTIVRFDRWEEADRLIAESTRAGFQLLTLADDAYPKLLREIYDPPVLLWIWGDVAALDKSGVAVVGTRQPSAYGREMAEQFSRELIREGLTIVSGLAYGIDGIAHRQAVEAGSTTVAVLGSGVDRIYPSKHIGLAKRIVETGGAVISEFPPGTKPDAVNFPVRNRVVSGLTLGTLVVESGMEGGSMITARLALDQNREVFVVPHALQNRTAAGTGCNYLIQTGQGKLVQSIGDILNEIATHTKIEPAEKKEPPARKWKSVELDKLAVSICSLLEESDSPRHIDELGARLDLPSHKLLPKLLELEMLECVKQSAGRNFELR